MSTIIIFSEQRSGSTALSTYLTKRLNLDITYDSVSKRSGKSLREQFESQKIDIQPNNFIFTHDFDLLKHLDKFKNPILIYSTRQNKVEQCLSNLIMKYVNHTLPEKDRVSNCNKSNYIKVETIYNQAKPKVFLKSEVVRWCNMKKEIDSLWKEYGHRYKNQTIYYEQMFESIDIPNLDLFNCNIFADSNTKKMPEYKANLCLNKKSIEQWIREEFSTETGFV